MNSAVNNYKCFGENNKMKDFSIRSKKKKKGGCHWLGGALRYFIFSGWNYFLWNPNFLDKYEDLICDYVMSCCFSWKKKRILWDSTYYFIRFCILPLTSLVSPKTPKIDRGSKFSWVLQWREDKDAISGGKVCVPRARTKAITELFTNEPCPFLSSSPIVLVFTRTLHILS